MYNVQVDSEFSPDHKDVSKVRIERDENDVHKLEEQFRQFNVFGHDHQELVCLTTNDVAPTEVTQALLNAKQRGYEKLEKFVQQRLCETSVGFHDTLHNVKVLTLHNLYQTQASSGITNLKLAKADRNLFQRLLVAKDSGRDINLKGLLEHELSPIPLSLACTSQQLRSADKAPLGKILGQDATVSSLPSANNIATCTVIDGQALVQAMGKTAQCKTFGDFAEKFSMRVFDYLGPYSPRVDVVFDRYQQLSIKASTRQKRAGADSRPIRRIVDSCAVPMVTNWKQFIDLPDNKSNLSHFLSEQLMVKAQAFEHYEVIVGGGFEEVDEVRSSTGHDVSCLQSTHEEADTRIILHAIHAQHQDFERLVVVCHDTDVLVLLIHFAEQLSKEIWFKTGTAKKTRLIKVHAITVPPRVRTNLPAFHAITGCDTVSQFYGIGKRSAWRYFLIIQSSLMTWDLIH
jgi:hypothetical protein